VILVRRLTADDTLENLQMLFVGEGERNRLADLLRPVISHPILTVTESEGALLDGSIFNFTIEERRVRFEVSLDAVERAGLRVNSRLLAVAQRVLRNRE
jgi:hypothetical protein